MFISTSQELVGIHNGTSMISVLCLQLRYCSGTISLGFFLQLGFSCSWHYQLPNTYFYYTSIVQWYIIFVSCGRPEFHFSGTTYFSLVLYQRRESSSLNVVFRESEEEGGGGGANSYVFNI